MSRRFARVVPLSVAFAALALAPALAADVSIAEQSFKTGKTTVTLKGLRATDTNLSQADIVKMLAPDTPKAERAALLKTFKAARFAVPSLEVKDDKATATVRDLMAEGVDAGKVAKASIGGAEGTGEKGMSFKTRGLVAENGDFSSLAAALVTGDMTSAAPRFSSFKFDGFDASFMEEGPKEKAGRITLALTSMEARSVLEGEVFRSGDFTLKNLVITPEKGSKMGRDLAAFGYDKLDIGMTSAGAYDPATKALTITDFTVSGAGAGALTLTGALGGVEKTFSSPDHNQQLAAFLGADMSQLQVKYDDAGLFQKALVYVAGKRDPEAVRAEWKAAAGQYLPMLLGGDASALGLAAAAQSFIAAPKNITLTATGKEGPVKLMDLPGLKDPMALLQKITLTAVANQ